MADMNNILGGLGAAPAPQPVVQPQAQTSFSQDVIAGQQAQALAAVAAQAAAPVAGQVAQAPGATADFAELFRKTEKSAKLLDDTFEGLPKGDYLSTVEKITIKLSTNGKPMAVFQYKVIDGDKANSKEWETTWLRDYNTDALDIKTLGKRLQAIFNSTQEAAVDTAFKIIGSFIDGGQNDLVMDSTNGLPVNSGMLKITKYDYVPKKGANAGIKQEGTNYSFKAA